MKKQQAGMTLIELVIVIIVLGIIAAVAAPKFADIKGNAATAAKEGTVGAVDSAYTIATAKSQGAPTIDVMMTQMVGLTCDTTNFDTCVSADKDGDG
ncbi:MAG: prepilin-type N-terminal cleavage/methylation domain-containing protein, partial [Gammaproteobacteria bacterium]|nr:prepilin-type N-terminal cleavage/methylation domain-containing protein [Gammaproteobacteria bacterium]